MLSFALVVAQLRPTARHRPAALQPPRPPSSSNASAHDGRHDHNASTNSSLRLSADQDGWEPIPTSISDGGGGGPVAGTPGGFESDAATTAPDYLTAAQSQAQGLESGGSVSTFASVNEVRL